MSADDGWILRRNTVGQLVLQHYQGDDLPDVEYDGAMKFDTIEEAVLKYNELDSGDYPSEYGLITRL